MSRPPLVEGRGLSKRFPGVQALAGVDLDIPAGEVLGLVGENGAGKSTLIRILGGVIRPNAGELYVDGRRTRFQTVRDSLACGIALLHQEGSLCDNLSVAENLFLGRLPARTRLGWCGGRAQRELIERSRRALAAVGLEVAPSVPVAALGPGPRQLVEIARALSQDARLLVLDEPTSSLGGSESAQLLEQVEALRERGLAVVYVSHRLGEVERVCDRVVVLRDGAVSGRFERAQVSRDTLVRSMVGRDVERARRRRHGEPQGPVVLQVDGLHPRSGPAVARPANGISFQLSAGEILGFGGLVGAGRSEVARALFGIEPPRAGRIEVDGRTIDPRSPRQAIDAGIRLVPEDRKHHGLVLELAVGENLTLACRSELARAGRIDSARERALQARLRERLQVRAASLDVPVGTLSGGNQQKVAVGRWLPLRGRVLILDEPTRGVDVGAREEIHRLVESLAAEGLGVLVISSELDELIRLSDRVCVFRDGHISGELEGDAISEESVMRLAVAA